MAGLAKNPLMAGIMGGLASEVLPTVAVYALKFITAADASTILQTAVPKAELTPDSTDTARLRDHGSNWAHHRSIRSNAASRIRWSTPASR